MVPSPSDGLGVPSMPDNLEKDCFSEMFCPFGQSSRLQISLTVSVPPSPLAAPGSTMSPSR
eukprot:1468674-Pyramimonas_sp.AAC.1